MIRDLSNVHGHSARDSEIAPGQPSFPVLIMRSGGSAPVINYFCAQDARCRAGADIDGALHGRVLQTGVHKPFPFLLSGLGDFSSDAESRRIMAEIQSVYDRLPPETRVMAVIRGANHFMFSDDPALLKSGLVRAVLRGMRALRIDGARQLAITRYCVRTFFDASLKGEHPTFSSPLYPELEIRP